MSTSMNELELELEGLGELEYEHETGEFDLKEIAADAARAAMESEGEGEGEFEFELEGEGEQNELNPVRRFYRDAILEMEHYGYAAAESESAEQGEQFLPLLAPLAAKIVPFALKAGAKFLPKIAGKVFPKLARRIIPRVTRLVRGPMGRALSRVGRSLLRRRRSRPLARTLPTIARRSVGNIVRQTMAGRTVTPRMAQQIVARNAARVIGNPQIAAQVMRRSRIIDRRYHSHRPVETNCQCTCSKRTTCSACGR